MAGAPTRAGCAGGTADCRYLFLPLPGLPLPGLSLLGLSWRPSLSLGLPCPLLGRSAGLVRCLPVEESPSAEFPEPAVWDVVGWLLGGWAASAAPPARPGAATAVGAWESFTAKPRTTPLRAVSGLPLDPDLLHV